MAAILVLACCLESMAEFDVCVSAPDTSPSYFMFFKAKQVSSCYSVEKQSLSNQMSVSDTEIHRNI